MRFRVFVSTISVCLAAVSGAHAATIAVPAGGDLQAAIDQAQPGDVITLAPNATYVGNFVLPNKGALSGAITIRSAAADALLPAAGVRMTPSYAALLPKIKSSNDTPALRTATAANHWTLMLLELQANVGGYGDIIALGSGDKTQTDLTQVPYALVLDHLYVHGDPVIGQKRGISLHSRDTSVINSWVSDCKAVGQEAQAISGFNGPGGYLIENNYLQGATQNFLIGGADPVIPNLVTSDITFRYNHLEKPVAWRDAIVAAPAGVAAAAAADGGSLAAGIYFYSVQARRPAGQTNVAISSASLEASATIAVGTTTGSVAISWQPVAGAQDYVVWRRVAGGTSVNFKTAATSLVDVGAAGTAEKQASGTTWLVKNIFELKNAQHVLVEGNVFENNWVAGQPGYAILFTPRNQGGTAPWVVVQDATFQNNIVRHTAGGVNILGTDNVSPSQRTNHITVRQNLFDDLNATTWSSNGSKPCAIQLGDGADTVTIDHNTIFATNPTIVCFYGAATTNFVYTNNMSAHNNYGINGSGASPGMLAITTYAADGVFRADVLAGGTASKYPAGNYFPAVASWLAGFKDYAKGDFHLLPAFAATYPSTDGADLGPDIDTVNAMTAKALSGNIGAHMIITPTTQWYEQQLTCEGGSSPCAWRLVETSQLPAGLAFEAQAGKILGTPTAVQTGVVVVEAYDPSDPTNFARAQFNLSIEPPPLALIVPASSRGRVGLAYALTPTVTGAVGPTLFTLVAPDNQLPGGLGPVDPATGTVTGMPVTAGSWTVTLQVTDSVDRADRRPSQPIMITIDPAPIVIAPIVLPDGRQNTMYSANLNATGGIGAISWSLASGTLPDMTVNPSGTISGVPGRAGTFPFTVRATDAAGASATANASLTIAPAATTAADVVLYAADAKAITGTWSLVDDPTAAGGRRIASPDAGAPKLAAPLASPANYFELTFQAQAGVPYHLWMRGKAQGNQWTNDSVYVQFSGAVTAAGAAINRIGTTTAAAVSIEEASGAGLSGWGWADDSYGGLAAPMYFEATGLQTIRVQVREDGVSLDQIVLGADKYVAAPGLTKNDTTILGRAGGTFREIVLYAADAAVNGAWSIVADATAAGGRRLANPDAAAPKLAAALAAPQNYFELTFVAEAGVPYHLWMRGKAQGNQWTNDSVYVQFSGAVTAAGAPINGIGTTSGAAVSIEDGSGAGLSEWGWADDSYGGFAAPMYFGATGAQTIRVQVREDGVSLDQIVLSADRYSTAAPGAAKNDATIVPR